MGDDVIDTFAEILPLDELSTFSQPSWITTNNFAWFLMKTKVYINILKYQNNHNSNNQRKKIHLQKIRIKILRII